MANLIFVDGASPSNENRINENIIILTQGPNTDAEKLKAIEFLENAGDQKAVPHLISVLLKADFPYRFDAIHALGALGGDQATKFLLKLKDKLENEIKKLDVNNDIQNLIGEKAYVIAALYKLKASHDISFLYENIKSPDKILRYTTASAAGMVKDPKTTLLLYDILENDEQDLPRCGAAAALIEQSNPNVFNTISQLVAADKGPIECFDDLLSKRSRGEP